MSTIYGFYAGSHSASSVLVEDGKIRFAVEEERISRVKAGLQYESYPVLSHTVISEKSGINASTADYVVVADPTNQDFMEKLSEVFSKFDKLKELEKIFAGSDEIKITKRKKSSSDFEKLEAMMA
jgi:predicted NodU family carbamoyl transferase